MNTSGKQGLALWVGPLLFLFYALAFAAENLETVTLGTATKGGGFEVFGSTLAEVVNATSTNVRLEPVPTRGSKQNLEDLAQGKIMLGLVEGNAARQALEGIGSDRLDFKVLSVMYPNPGMFVVRADSHYQAIADLQGQPIAFGTRASGLRILANDVLDGLGLDPERDFQQIILDKAGDGPNLVLDKKVAALWGAGIGWPGFVKVADSAAGARFIPPTATQITQILKKHPHLKRMSVPAGTYRGQDRDIQSIGLWSLVLVSPAVSNDTAYQLARATHRGEILMAEKLQQGRYATASNTVENVAIELLHPGARKYYQELNLLPKN